MDFSGRAGRRTALSNTKRLKVDFETAEAMLNHAKTGLARTYDTYTMEEEKRAWILKWEEEVKAIAVGAGLGEMLEVPPSYGEMHLPAAQRLNPLTGQLNVGGILAPYVRATMTQPTLPTDTT